MLPPPELTSVVSFEIYYVTLSSDSVANVTILEGIGSPVTSNQRESDGCLLKKHGFVP